MSGAFGGVPNAFQNAVTATGLQLDNNNATISAYINDPTNRNNFATDSGNTATFAISLAPAPSAYSTGLEITFKTSNANAAAAQVNVNSLGAKNIIDQNGQALVINAYPSGSMVNAVYNGSAFVAISAPYLWQGGIQNTVTSTIGGLIATGALSVTGVTTASSGVLTGTTQATLNGSAGQLIVGLVNAAITSTADAFVAWNGSSSGYDATNGSLLLYARNAAGAGIVGVTGNTVRWFTDNVTGGFRVNCTANLCVNAERLSVKNTGIGNAAAAFSNDDGSGQSTILVHNAKTSTDNIFASFLTEALPGTARGSIDYNRGGGAVRYNTTSNAELKNIFGDANPEISKDILRATRIAEYEWKDNIGKRQIGVIAQEVLASGFTGAVSCDASGTPVAIDKTAWNFHLIAGWQAHDKDIAKLIEDVALLKAKLGM